MKINLNVFFVAVTTAVILALCPRDLLATTLNVGPGQTYTNLSAAFSAATPGDTVLIHPGNYLGAFFLIDVQGVKGNPITVRGVDRSSVVFLGASEAIHLSSCHHLTFENFTVRRQTGNGFNIDDGGTITQPTTNIVVRNVSFEDMNATGNNDFLKLSGLDSFLIEDCSFKNGAEGGSGIDMVGCHYGIIRKNTFTNLGSNCIQAKGGTHHISIERNFVANGGQRAFNVGGSTGLQFFRPANATFEAADISVTANIVIGGVTPIGYVGVVRADVSNNTFINPEKWGFRILQETVDETRFEKCGNNIFRNNIVWFNSGVSVMVNVGSNTSPETFLITNNLFYRHTNPTASGWNVGGVTQVNSLVGMNPLFADTATKDFSLLPSSGAIAAGAALPSNILDFTGKPFANPPSIGAMEGKPTTSVEEHKAPYLNFYPNPSVGVLTVEFEDAPFSVDVYSLNGKLLISTKSEQRSYQMATESLPPGAYVLRLSSPDKSLVRIFAVQ
ncbi:MAG: right-handed parallel beta-helix repeat-containing protein [Ignavibacteria bacterium]|nr:right-handed parallel beta-helix repeat-containing protein [Ignavibacteria bacterium]